MAGFQVAINGRFWVATEDSSGVGDVTFRRTEQSYFLDAGLGSGN
jgi:hypothetical protein